MMPWFFYLDLDKILYTAAKFLNPTSKVGIVRDAKRRNLCMGGFLEKKNWVYQKLFVARSYKFL